MIPVRGDEVESWLEGWRDMYADSAPEWFALNDLLDEYLLHAAAGTPLPGKRPLE